MLGPLRLAALVEEPRRLLAERDTAFVRFGCGDEPLRFRERIRLGRLARLLMGRLLIRVHHLQRHSIEGVETWDEPGLTGPRLKVVRAHELFMALQMEGAQFRLNGQLVLPSAPRSETDSQGDKWGVFYCEKVAEIPMRFSLLAGDLVHNARSALDYLIYQLVCLEGNEPTKRNAWPVFSEKPVGHALSRYNAALMGIKNAHVLNMIEWFQPYQMPTNPLRENLALLADLDNIDKHRLIRPGVAVITDAVATHEAVVSAGEVKEGNEIFRLREPAPTGNGYVGCKYEMAFWDQQATVAKLSELIETIKGVIEKFAPAFFANT
jgi:hypothetical protein